jgi:endogenous inhibitor of DNA gyrase (YacG/DUF329 family)
VTEQACPECGDGSGWYVPVAYAGTGITVNCLSCNDDWSKGVVWEDAEDFCPACHEPAHTDGACGELTRTGVA